MGSMGFEKYEIEPTGADAGFSQDGCIFRSDPTQCSGWIHAFGLSVRQN